MKKYYKAPLVGVDTMQMHLTLEEAIYSSSKTVLMDIIVKKTFHGYREVVTGKKIPILRDVPIFTKHQSNFEFQSEVPRSGIFIVDSPLEFLKEYSMKEVTYEEFVDYHIEYLPNEKKLFQMLNDMEEEYHQKIKNFERKYKVLKIGVHE